jgi:hypothetical protein
MDAFPFAQNAAPIPTEVLLVVAGIGVLSLVAFAFIAKRINRWIQERMRNGS